MTVDARPVQATSRQPILFCRDPSTTDADDALSRRLLLEFDAAGLDVINVIDVFDFSPRAGSRCTVVDPLARVRALGAIAEVLVMPGRLSVRVRPREEGIGSVLTEDSINTVGVPEGVVALRAMELLHTAAIARAPVPPAAAAAPVKAEVPLRSAGPSVSRWSVSAQAAELISGGGTPATGGVALGVRAPAFGRPGGLGELELFTAMAASLWGSPLTGAAGRADLHWQSVAVGADLRWSGAGRWTARAGACLRGFRLAVTGQAAPPRLSRTDSTLTGGPFAEAAALYRLLPRWQIGVTMGVGAVARPPAIRFAGQEIARWGQPIVLAAMGLEWSAF